uniref:Uncharacterized protein n=1 Tax=Meloidogyne hapla TaxID=6305 RepID=A0A1I8AZK9_MELHA
MSAHVHPEVQVVEVLLLALQMKLMPVLQSLKEVENNTNSKLQQH